MTGSALCSLILQLKPIDSRPKRIVLLQIQQNSILLYEKCKSQTNHGYT